MSSHRPSGADALLLAGAALALALVLPGPAAAFAFEEVADAEGIRFLRAGDPEDRADNFLELMGGGACWLDADGDSLLDLYLVNGWYNKTHLAEEKQPRSHLYRNLGPGEGFEEVAAAMGVAEQGWYQACSAADYDGDGDDDLLLVGYGLQTLFRNDGHGFTNVTAASGLTPEGKCPEKPCWGSGSAWADYDRDGDLDLYVINFVKYGLEEGGHFAGPGNRVGQPNQLYRNDGGGAFTDVTAAANATNAPGPQHAKDWGVVWVDYDRDGWLDLYIAGDGTPNALLRNLGDGTFEDVAAEAGVDDPRNGMGVAAADCNGDAYEELFITHYGHDFEVEFAYDGFYVNEGDGTFSDHSGEGDLNVTYPYVKWGVGFEDFDNDGDLDLHVATGHAEGAVDDFDQPPLLWAGDGACGWTDRRGEGGPAMKLLRNSRGSAYADHDLDGDVDIAVVNIMEQAAMLLRNTHAAPHRWLTLELRDPGMNTRGIGAELNITTPDGRSQHRRMMPYQSIHGSNAMQVHVGLGGHATADVTVRWPDTWATTTYEGLAADQRLRLHRDGRVQNDTFPPRSALVVTGAEPGEDGWWRGSAAQVHAVAEDAGHGFVSGVAQVALSLDGGPEVGAGVPLAVSEGEHRARLWSEDAQGNREVPREVFVGLDGAAPVSTATFEGTLVDGWYQGPVAVTLACADAVSGPSRLEWRVGEDPWTVYLGPFAATRPGSHVLAWRCIDRAGNIEAAQGATLSIDLGHPETVPRLAGLEGHGGWWRSEVEVRLEGYAAPRALAGTWYALDGAPWATYEGPFVVQGDGVHVLRFRSLDDAGNEEPERILEVRIDATPPALAVVDQGPTVAEAGALRIGPRHGLVAVAADDGSGLAAVQVARDGGALRPQRQPVRFSIEGFHELRAVAEDAAGNAAEATLRVVLDLTPPALEVAWPQPNSVNAGPVGASLPVALLPWYAVLVGEVPLEAAPGADPSGIAQVRFLVDERPAAVVTAPPWVWTYDLPLENVERTLAYVVEDGVGNARAVRYRAFVAGSTDPWLAWLPQPLAAPGAPGPSEAAGSTAVAAEGAPAPASRTGEAAPPGPAPLALAPLGALVATMPRRRGRPPG